MRILFVCSGNTCRSPLAAALFQEKVKGSDIEVKSVGATAATGDPLSSPVQALLQERGINYPHQSQKINPEHIEWADLVLTMARSQKYILISVFPAIAPKIAALKEFVEADGNPDIDDPYGQNLDHYRQLATDLDPLLDRLHAKLSHAEI